MHYNAGPSPTGGSSAYPPFKYVLPIACLAPRLLHASNIVFNGKIIYLRSDPSIAHYKGCTFHVHTRVIISDEAQFLIDLCLVTLTNCDENTFVMVHDEIQSTLPPSLSRESRINTEQNEKRKNFCILLNQMQF